MSRIVVMALVATALSGCADLEPFDPPVAGEMMPGPGLFSGADGEFVLTPADLGVGAETAGSEPAAAADRTQRPPRPGLRLPPPDQDLTLPPPAAR